MQLSVDEPLSYFYARVETGEILTTHKVSHHDRPVADFDGNLKIHLVPEAKNKILIRLENLADLFDGAPEQTPIFDIHKYAVDLYAANNNGSTKGLKVKIVERTLSNSMNRAEWSKEKFSWPTEQAGEGYGTARG